MPEVGHFSGSYSRDDVRILLKPCEIEPVDVVRKETLIQSGHAHYSEMLSEERLPDAHYMRLYAEALARNAARLHGDVRRLASLIEAEVPSAEPVILISLARAGTPIGVLLNREMRRRARTAHHYSISIIRDRGIDENALAHIVELHGRRPVVFVDGWTGKGAIRRQLDQSLAASPSGLNGSLAVIADPAGRADMAATVDDYMIPSGILNGIVSGLISRSVLRPDLVGPGDFHACRFYEEHAENDSSAAFVTAVEDSTPVSTGTKWTPDGALAARRECDAMIEEIARAHGVHDANRIKPGVAEATRAVLRRVPERLLISDLHDPDVAHLRLLAEQQGVMIEERRVGRFKAVTIIKAIGGAQE